MTVFENVMQRFDRRARIGLALGAVLILATTIAVAAWLLRTDHQVLFADLTPQDAATIVAELDKMKVPYRLSGDGNTVLVPADLVYPTRLKLVGRELPLRGAVGLELFNASEVGMTEFTQKINYQRALQGEITRTIGSLDEVQAVRVHLVLAEQTLFKKTGKQAKASITLSMKPGRSLDSAQVQGIQRLVAAAVPDIKAEDVTIVDQRGVALTRRAGDSADVLAGPAAGAALDDKRALETYLNKKVVDVLDATFGAGHGIATVDVTLNHDHTKITTERVLGAAEGGTKSEAGVMVRERRTTRESETETDAESAGETVNHETDYQVGRQVEQVVSGGSRVARISVAVVLRDTLDVTQLERLKDVVTRAVGIDGARGDSVAVYSMNQVMAPALAAPSVLPSVTLPSELPPTPAAPTVRSTEDRLSLPLLGAGIAVLALGAATIVLRRGRRPAQARLSHQQRQEMLTRVQGWLDTTPQTPGERF